LHHVNYVHDNFFLPCIREFLSIRILRYLQLIFFLSFHTFYEKSYSYRKGPFVCNPFSFFTQRFLLCLTELNQPLKSLFKSFPYFNCSSMTVPTVIQPNIQLGISDQTNIALNLFSTTLRTANTREELERSWAAIEQDIATQEQLEARQRERRNPH
jgi:hypothetical protein